MFKLFNLLLVSLCVANANKTYIVSLKPGSFVTTSMIEHSIDYFQIGDYSGLIVDEEIVGEFTGLDVVEDVEVNTEF